MSEVTPEMIEAAGSALQRFGSDPMDDELIAAYQAMKALDPEVEMLRAVYSALPYQLSLNAAQRDVPLDMCAHGAIKGSYCSHCRGPSAGASA